MSTPRLPKISPYVARARSATASDATLRAIAAGPDELAASIAIERLASRARLLGEMPGNRKATPA